MNGLPYDFTDKEVSPWGGLRLIEETYRRSGLKQYLEEECQNLPTTGSNRGYSSVDLAEGFMVSTILGATRLSHSGTLRRDEVIERIFGWDKEMANQSTFSRFFRRFDQERNGKVFPAINQFRLQVLNNKHHPVLSAMRFQCIAIGSYLVKTGRKATLKLSAKQNRRLFLEGLFSKVANLSPPFQISNA